MGIRKSMILSRYRLVLEKDYFFSPFFLTYGCVAWLGGNTAVSVGNTQLFTDVQQACHAN
jgi:hypothetical protein